MNFLRADVRWYICNKLIHIKAHKLTKVSYFFYFTQRFIVSDIIILFFNFISGHHSKVNWRKKESPTTAI